MADLEEEVLARIERQRKLRPRFKDEHITMAHGAGGKASHTLITGLIAPAFGMDGALSDAASLTVQGAELAFTTDAFVVQPLAFPGGSIGDLAVNGTVNDLAVSGAKPLAIAVALVLEEGLDAEILKREVAAMSGAAERAGVGIVTGDTKVVERGKADGMYIITTGIGLRDRGSVLSTASVKPGDRIVCSGAIGDHGTAIMLARGELELDADVVSDTAPLWHVARAVMEAAGDDLRVMRDPTRGGLATVLNEIAADAGVGIVVDEAAVPVASAVRGACEILGIDPMYVANEGKLVAVVAAGKADAVLEAMRATAGQEATIIGAVAEEPSGMVLVKTGFGGTRIMDMMIGDPLPRIC